MTKAQAPYALTTLKYDERNLPLAMTTGGMATNYRYSDGGQRGQQKGKAAEFSFPMEHPRSFPRTFRCVT